MDVAKRMKELRKAKGISAETIAEALGTNPTTIYRYEKGDIEKMPLSILEPIAKILGCSPAYLMGWTDDPNIYVQKQNEKKRNRLLEILNSEHEGSIDIIPSELEDALCLFEQYKNASPRDRSIVDSLLKPIQPDS